MISFNNTYTTLPEEFYKRQSPADFSQAKLIAFNEELAQELGIHGYSQEELTQFFSGQKLFKGSDPIAMAYAGMQFGHPVPQLGDGRALLLGEVNGFDIQLKGSGQTPFSRRGDGRSALGPVLREYIVSEAMHALGVPTTRALAAVETGETVLRQFGPEPGGVFTRVASSHIRVGTFQYFAFKKDHENLKVLLDYTLKRHYSNLLSLKDQPERCLALLREFTRRQSDLVAKWSGLGFIHGVMNTDNFALDAITIDYGPCAFMDKFTFHKKFSSIDEQGRYSFWNQVPIAKWNILRLADCLLPLIDSDIDVAISKVEKELEKLFPLFEKKREKIFAQKMALKDQDNSSLVEEFLSLLEKEKLDFTKAFRELPHLYSDESTFFPESKELHDFKENWLQNIDESELEQLDAINPLSIPRNHIIEKVIDLGYEGNFSLFHQVNKVLKNPFEELSESFGLDEEPEAGEVVKNTYCGT